MSGSFITANVATSLYFEFKKGGENLRPYRLTDAEGVHHFPQRYS